MGIGNGLKYAALVVALGLGGCKSDADKANDAAVQQAKQQAAASGTAQQVVSTDKDGNTVTTVVQPPAPGQTTQTVTTTRTTRTVSTSNNAVAPAPAQTTSAPAPVAAGETPLNSAPAGAGYGAGSGTLAPVPGRPVITPVDVHVPRGTTLAIRINQHINVKTAHAGERFTGEVVNAVTAEGTDRVAIPRGTPVNGVIDASHRRGHFKGRSILELRLTSMTLNGQSYRLDTHDNVRTKKGKGKRSAAFIGGGSGLGMLVGGLASGGVGLVVGGLAGAGAGTAIGGLTGNRDIDIPAESVMNFRLADDLVVQPQ